MPEAMPLARHVMSAFTPKCSMAENLPVRPTPHWTSSATRRMPCLSQILRRPWMNSTGGTT